MNVRPYNQNQVIMFPGSVRDRLPDEHLAVVISDICDSLDLRKMYQDIPPEGNPSYHPLMMTKVLIYAYATGTFSSRRIAKALYDQIPYIFLSGWQTPDFRTISDFRKRYLQSFLELLRQVILICKGLGMVKMGYVCLDGSKFKANASDENTYDQKRLQRQIAALLEKAEQVDEEEDARYGKDRSGDELPEEIRNRQDRLRRLTALKEKLEARGAKKLNATDPEAVFMKTRGGLKTSYNAQLVVDDTHQVIVASDVTNRPHDTDELVPMLDQSELNTGECPKQAGADAGFFSGDNLAALDQRKIEGFIPDCMEQGRQRGKGGGDFGKEKFRYCPDEDYYLCPGGQRLVFSHILNPNKGGGPVRIYRGSACRNCEHFGQCTRSRAGRAVSRFAHDELVERMREKLATEEGRRCYAKRKVVVEPVFGQIKHIHGVRGFLLRGLAKVKGEFGLVCIGHNMRKVGAFLQGHRFRLPGAVRPQMA
jgi:transposase